MKAMKQCGLTRWLMAAACAGALGTVGATEEPVVERDMVVVATRDARDEATIPANVSVITGDMLREGSYATVADALRELVGVQIRSITGNPVAAEIGMRGFGENSHGRVLVLLDGRRLNRPDMAAINWLQLAPGQVERIEVLRGGASALYGDHAVGGVILLQTRRGQTEPENEISLEAGSFGTMAARLGSAGAVEALSYAVAADWGQSDGYRKRTGYESQGIGVRLGYDVSPVSDLFLLFGTRAVSFEIPGGLTRAEMRENRKQAQNLEDESSIEYLNVHGGTRWGLGQPVRIEADAFWSRREIESEMVSWMSHADNTLEAMGGSLAVVAEFSMGAMAGSFTAGADWFRDTMDVDRYGDAARAMRMISAELEKDTLGGYARFAVSPDDTLTVALAGRYETSEFKGEAESGGAEIYDESDRHRATAADLSAVKTLAGRSKIYAKGGTVYRYPFLDEQIGYFGYGADVFYTDIEPETGWNAEVGGRWAGADGWLDVAVFYSEMKDEIAWNPVVFRNENLEKTRRQGVEAAFRFAPRDSIVRVSGNYAYTEAVFADGDNDGKDIPLVPRHKASLSLGLALPRGFEAAIVSTYVGNTWLGGDFANAQEELSDYIVTDARLRYVSEQVPGLEAHVAVDNVLNEEYASLGYAGWDDNAYYPSPGIGVRGGLSYRF